VRCVCGVCVVCVWCVCGVCVRGGVLRGSTLTCVCVCGVCVVCVCSHSLTHSLFSFRSLSFALSLALWLFFLAVTCSVSHLDSYG